MKSTIQSHSKKILKPFKRHGDKSCTIFIHECSKVWQISNCQEKAKQYQVDFETFPHNLGTQIRNDQNSQTSMFKILKKTEVMV